VPRARTEETKVPELMLGAWHIDVHIAPMPALLAPSLLVAAIFKIPVKALAIGDEVRTIFGKFYVDDLVEGTASHILLHTWAPGSISRFSITVQRIASGSFEAILHNSVHPTSWLGRLYFRAIEPGHHLAMEVALRRLVSSARRSSAA